MFSLNKKVKRTCVKKKRLKTCFFVKKKESEKKIENKNKFARESIIVDKL